MPVGCAIRFAHDNLLICLVRLDQCDSLWSMKSKTDVLRQEFNRFSSDMVHGAYPGIDLFQLEPGAVKGWVFSTKIGPYYVNAGSFNRVLLYDGNFNPNMLHVGFIFSQDHTAMVQAHNYDSGTIDVNYGATYTHEIFPANMVWVNIYAPENIMMESGLDSNKKISANPHLVIKGSRDTLMPIIELVDEIILKSPKVLNNLKFESRLKKTLQKLFVARFSEDVYEQPFVTGDLFRMQLLKKIHKLSLVDKNQPLSLEQICESVKMKRRTVQKYFHDIYGMGPTEYFRIRRLNGARTDLMNGATSVSEVALQWGFTHFGRFSGSYKKLFNESPKATIEHQKII